MLCCSSLLAGEHHMKPIEIPRLHQDSTIVIKNTPIDALVGMLSQEQGWQGHTYVSPAHMHEELHAS